MPFSSPGGHALCPYLPGTGKILQVLPGPPKAASPSSLVDPSATLSPGTKQIWLSPNTLSAAGSYSVTCRQLALSVQGSCPASQVWLWADPGACCRSAFAAGKQGSPHPGRLIKEKFLDFMDVEEIAEISLLVQGYKDISTKKQEKETKWNWLKQNALLGLWKYP